MYINCDYQIIEVDRRIWFPKINSMKEKLIFNWHNTRRIDDVVIKIFVFLKFLPSTFDTAQITKAYRSKVIGLKKNYYLRHFSTNILKKPRTLIAHNILIETIEYEKILFNRVSLLLCYRRPVNVVFKMYQIYVERIIFF